MSNYITTVGRIISAKVGMKRSKQSSTMVQNSSLKKLYYPEITYEYTVNNQTYLNNQFWKEGAQLNLLTNVGSIVSQYPIGGKATVHYNPHNPSDSYLKHSPETENRRFTRLSAVITIAVLLGIAIFIFMSMQPQV